MCRYIPIIKKTIETNKLYENGGNNRLHYSFVFKGGKLINFSNNDPDRSRFGGINMVSGHAEMLSINFLINRSYHQKFLKITSLENVGNRPRSQFTASRTFKGECPQCA